MQNTCKLISTLNGTRVGVDQILVMSYPQLPSRKPQLRRSKLIYSVSLLHRQNKLLLKHENIRKK